MWNAEIIDDYTLMNHLMITDGFPMTLPTIGLSVGHHLGHLIWPTEWWWRFINIVFDELFELFLFGKRLRFFW